MQKVPGKLPVASHLILYYGMKMTPDKPRRLGRTAQDYVLTLFANPPPPVPRIDRRQIDMKDSDIRTIYETAAQVLKKNPRHFAAFCLGRLYTEKPDWKSVLGYKTSAIADTVLGEASARVKDELRQIGRPELAEHWIFGYRRKTGATFKKTPLKTPPGPVRDLALSRALHRIPAEEDLWRPDVLAARGVMQRTLVHAFRHARHPEQLTDVIIMRYFEDSPFSEIGKKLHITRVHASNLHDDALARLRKRPEFRL